jgi:signal transduction histidine kinase
LAILIVLAVYLKKIKSLNKKLVESNLIKDKLFSIIGHDLRSPIANVVQMMDVFGSIDFSSEERFEIIATLKKHSETSLETLDNLLQWGKAQLQGIKIKQTEIFPQLVFEKNINVYHIQTERKSITINNLIPETLTVVADPDHLNFIVRNLISNAVKFSYLSGIIEVTAVQHTNDMVAISVRDYGMGMSVENKKSVFQTFPIITIGTANEKGTGIGLMLCKEFTEANGGVIWVESTPGKGSVFSFTLKGLIGLSTEIPVLNTSEILLTPKNEGVKVDIGELNSSSNSWKSN